MKYLKLLFVACIISSTTLLGQSLTLDPATISTAGDPNELLEVHTSLTNNGPTQVITWKRITNDIPTGWTSSVCDLTTCWATFADAPGSPFTMTNGQSGNVYVKFDARNYPDGPAIPGTGYVEVRFYSLADSANYNALGAFTADLTTVGFFTPSQPNTYAVYPNPADDYANFIVSENHDLKTIDVINLVGKRVAYVDLSTSTVNGRIDLSQIPNGVYFVRFMDRNGQVAATKKLSVSH